MSALARAFHRLYRAPLRLTLWATRRNNVLHSFPWNRGRRLRLTINLADAECQQTVETPRPYERNA